MTYLQWQEKEKAFLDTLDLTEFINKGKKIIDIMDEIEEKYGTQYTKEDFIFNCMDSYDFMLYLKDKYKLHIVEKTSYQIF